MLFPLGALASLGPWVQVCDSGYRCGLWAPPPSPQGPAGHPPRLPPRDSALAGRLLRLLAPALRKRTPSPGSRPALVHAPRAGHSGFVICLPEMSSIWASPPIPPFFLGPPPAGACAPLRPVSATRGPSTRVSRDTVTRTPAAGSLPPPPEPPAGLGAPAWASSEPVPLLPHCLFVGDSRLPLAPLPAADSEACRLCPQHRAQHTPCAAGVA